MFKHEGYSNGAFSTKSEKSFYTNIRFVKFSEKIKQNSGRQNTMDTFLQGFGGILNDILQSKQ